MKTAIELAEVAGSFLPEEKGYFLMQEMSAMLRQQAKENERLQADLTTQAEINAVVTQLARKNAVECDSLKAALNDVTSRQEAKIKALVEALEQIKHSITQMQMPENDKRREVLLIQNTVAEAIAAAKETP